MKDEKPRKLTTGDAVAFWNVVFCPSELASILKGDEIFSGEPAASEAGTCRAITETNRT